MPQTALPVEIIKQHPGQVQVTRKVRVLVPGKHFPQLQPTEQRASYWGEAVEYAERHKFERHAKAWGAAHTGPGIRFICESDAIDDPDTKGFWTTLLWCGTGGVQRRRQVSSARSCQCACAGHPPAASYLIR